MYDESINWCGPYILSKIKWGKKLIPQVPFRYCCYIHDVNYSMNLTIMEAVRVNSDFYKAMKQVVINMKAPFYKKVYYMILARLYYLLVMLFIPVYWLLKWRKVK